VLYKSTFNFTYFTKLIVSCRTWVPACDREGTQKTFIDQNPGTCTNDAIENEKLAVMIAAWKLWETGP